MPTFSADPTHNLFHWRASQAHTGAKWSKKRFRWHNLRMEASPIADRGLITLFHPFEKKDAFTLYLAVGIMRTARNDRKFPVSFHPFNEGVPVIAPEYSNDGVTSPPVIFNENRSRIRHVTPSGPQPVSDPSVERLHHCVDRFTSPSGHVMSDEASITVRVMSWL